MRVNEAAAPRFSKDFTISNYILQTQLNQLEGLMKTSCLYETYLPSSWAAQQSFSR